MLLVKRSENRVEQLRDKLRIDRSNLDEDMLQQPFIFMDISEAYVNAISKRDEAKEKLARIDAKLAEVYRNMAAEEKERTSETKIGDKVIQDKEHTKAHDEWSTAHKEAGLLAALKDSFDQRGKMLRELASLYVAGYFDRVTTKAGKEEARNANAALARQAWRKKHGAE